MNSGVIQLSHSLDLAAAAAQALASSATRALEFGVLRIDERAGPWTIRARIVAKPTLFPDPFMSPLENIATASLVVIEGGARGGHRWQGMPFSRDCAWTSNASSVDVRVLVRPQTNLAPTQQLVCWAERAQPVTTFYPKMARSAQSLAAWVALATGASTRFDDLSIPPDADAVEVSLPNALIGIAVTYPIDVYQLDHTGAEVERTAIAAASATSPVIPLHPLAKFVAVISPAPTPDGLFFPLNYRVH